MKSLAMGLLGLTLALGCAEPGLDMLEDNERDDALDEDDVIELRQERLIEGQVTGVTIEIIEDDDIDDKYTVITDILVMRGLHYHDTMFSIDDKADGELGPLVGIGIDQFFAAQWGAFHLYKRYAGGPWERVVYEADIETPVGNYHHEASSFWALGVEPATRTLHDVGLNWYLGEQGFAVTEDRERLPGRYLLPDLTDTDLEFGFVPVIDRRFLRDLDGTYEVELEARGFASDTYDECSFSPDGYRCI